MAYSNLQILFPKKGIVMFLMLAPVPTLGKGRTAVFVHYKQLKKQSNKQDSFKPDTHSKQGLQVSGCPVNLDC